MGFSLAQIKSNYISAPKFYKEFGPATIEGVLEKIELRPNGSKRILIKVNSIDGIEKNKLPEKVRLTARTKVGDVFASDIITTKEVFLPNPMPIYPGDYNFHRQAWFSKIGAVGYTISPVIPLSINRPQQKFNEKN